MAVSAPAHPQSLKEVVALARRSADRLTQLAEKAVESSIRLEPVRRASKRRK